jgi:hypothetical protein
MRSNLIDVELNLHAETEKAVAVSDTGDSKDVVWLPKSQIELDVHKDTITVTMPEWLAKDKGLI